MLSSLELCAGAGSQALGLCRSPESAGWSIALTTLASLLPLGCPVVTPESHLPGRNGKNGPSPSSERKAR